MLCRAHRPWGPTLLSSLAVWATACSTDPGVHLTADKDDAGQSSSADGPLALGDSLSNWDLRGTSFSDDAGSVSNIQGDAACAMQSIQAERVPLDLYVMMDTSGSMLDRTTSGQTKWDAIKAALSSFFVDPQSAGLGVGLQYFPQIRAEVPESCTSDAMCGAFGPCFRVRACSGTGNSCQQNNQCGAGQSCILVGLCSLTGNPCIPVGAPCGAGPRGTPAGNTCSTFPGYCLGRDKCEVPAYAMPDVRVAELPGAGAALMSSLSKKQPDGLTPTAPALSGAIDHVRTLLRDNPGRRGAVVLATDGFPSFCAPARL